MKNWSSIDELLLDYEVIIKMIHVLSGLYIWELCSSMQFEWDVIMGRKKFKWPFVFYIINRYSLLVFLSLQLVLFNHPVDQPFACQTIYTLSYLFGQTALLTASINLAIRTIAIWSNRFVTAGLNALIFGNCIVLILEVHHARASFISGLGCTPSNPDETASWLRAAFLYAMVLDFVVLLLSSYKLTIGMTPIRQIERESSGQVLIGQSRLVQVLFVHGLIYYLSAFFTGVLSIVFLSLRLNIAMNHIALAPTQVISTIAACRAVRSLANFNDKRSSKAVHVPGIGNTRNNKIHTNNYNNRPSAKGMTRSLHVELMYGLLLPCGVVRRICGLSVTHWPIKRPAMRRTSQLSMSKGFTQF